MKIYITGGSGMVGKNLVSKLEKCPDVNLLAPKSSEVNLLNQESVLRSIETFEPDIVIHCAGKVGGIAANKKDPYVFLYENILMGVNVVNSCKQLKVKNVINLGSSCIYPKNAVNPLKENSLLTGLLEETNEGYALAKLSVLKLCKYVREQTGWNYATIIPCNLYGPYDKFDPENSHMIPSVIRKIHEAKKNKENEVVIWGDGTARREFLFVEDLVEFIIFAINNIAVIPDIMNFGCGFDYSVLEYYQTTAEVLEYKPQFVFDLSKPTGVGKKLVDVSEMKKLCYVPKTSLKSGIELTYKYFLSTLSY